MFLFGYLLALLFIIIYVFVMVLLVCSAVSIAAVPIPKRTRPWYFKAAYLITVVAIPFIVWNVLMRIIFGA